MAVSLVDFGSIATALRRHSTVSGSSGCLLPKFFYKPTIPWVRRSSTSWERKEKNSPFLNEKPPALGAWDPLLHSPPGSPHLIHNAEAPPVLKQTVIEPKQTLPLPKTAQANINHPKVETLPFVFSFLFLLQTQSSTLKSTTSKLTQLHPNFRHITLFNLPDNSSKHEFQVVS